MKYLVAVSGGVDSVVLLDKLVREGKHELVVAHFDHGIRDDSADDALFVEGLAALHSLPFVTERRELGKNASEAHARAHRYAFLRIQAKRLGAAIVTAHHADDILESIAINLSRGTGWRGLAVLDGEGMVRPLLSMTKADIRDYARARRLEWVEDSTNETDAYLRNRLRRKISAQLPEPSKRALLELRREQRQIKRAVDHELRRFIRPNGEYSRYFFTMIDDMAAGELLRFVVLAREATPPTRPQAARALIAVKTAAPGTSYQVGTGVSLRFSLRTLIVETS